MKSALAWIKSNPISLASAVVAFVCICVLGYLFFQGLSFRASSADEVDSQVNQLRSFTRESIQLPPENANEPPRQLNVTINDQVIQYLTELQNRMDTEAGSIFQYAVQRNQAGHPTLADSVFPGPSNSSARIEARNSYREAFSTMLQDLPDGAEPVLPRLNAGMPPAPQEVQQAVQIARNDYVQSVNLFSAGEEGGFQNNNANTPNNNTVSEMGLTPEQSETLRSEMYVAMMRRLVARARSINLYADVDMGSLQAPNPSFPYQVAAWSTRGDSPEPWQLWEGQLELWIQQDLSRAIMLANQVGEEVVDPLADDGQTTRSNVITGPVKRLLGMQIIPGYIGLHSNGATNTVYTDPSSQGLGGTGGTGQPDFATNLSPSSPYSPPTGGQTNSGDQPIPRNFFLGPTGRGSNGLFDVRHAVLSVVVDSQRLPELYDAISSVNFMTVLNTRISEVDEYEDLRQGYVYGTGDVVRADLVIETIWLRSWTAELMPSLVRQYVGIDAPAEGANFGAGSGYSNPGNPAGRQRGGSPSVPQSR